MLYNCKVLRYKDSTHIEIFTSPIKRTEEETPNKTTGVISNKVNIIKDLQKDLNAERSSIVSMNRSKSNLYRIARSNTWQYFITLTFNRDNTDASDYDEVQKKLSRWTQKMHKRDPDFKYIIVPEFHKDGKNYHFHGLVSNCACMDLVDSGHVDDLGNRIFNINSWEWGYTFASEIIDNARVTSYIGKYITKELMQRIKYKKRYFCSDNVDLVPIEYYNIVAGEYYEYFDPDDYTFLKTVNAGGYNQIKYIEMKNKELTNEDGV